LPDYENYDYLGQWRRREVEDNVEKELLAGIVKGSSCCLELGGGFGRLASSLEGVSETYVMVDASSKGLRLAGSRLRSAHLVRCDIGWLPFRSGSFDSSFMVRVIHHLRHPQSALAEMARVTRQGGAAVISFPNTIYGTRRRLTRLSMVGRGPQGHYIYAGPFDAYRNPMLVPVDRRGVGLFDNWLGRLLRSSSLPASLDLGTSSLWPIKPLVFVTFLVSRAEAPLRPR
jgi:ubiquinone/menaquinone biosynthesis C-methylase UbiE